MKAQKLRTFSDFLKRAEIIPQTLLVITKDECIECEEAVMELRSLNYDIPFYELNLSENPNLIKEIEEHYQIESVPTFLFFRGTKLIGQITGFDKSNNFTKFLTSAVHQTNY